MKDNCPSAEQKFLIALWGRLLARLDDWDPSWRSRSGLAQSQSAGAQESTGSLTNCVVFEAFTLALLSGNTRWDRIARIRNELATQFAGFDPDSYAHFDHARIERLVDWFRDRKAGSANLRNSLLRLRQTAAMFGGDTVSGGAKKLISHVLSEADGSPEHAAMLLGNSRQWKLPGFGIALAAEGLRNLGFDLCKPDRHVLRALASWELVEFARWQQKGAYTAPSARPQELLASMLMVRQLAKANRATVTSTNSAIWLAGAVSGARLTNEQLAALTPGCRDNIPSA